MVNTKPVNIILGTANFGEEKGSWWNESDSHVLQAFSLLQKYGHNKLDSAQAYLGSEARLGSLQAGTRHNLSIDTKWRGGWAQEPNANSADNILATAKDSIQKLGVSSVDIFYIHAPIYNHPLEDTLSGVDAAHKAGLFKHFGLSNFPSADVQKVYDICRQENFVLPSVYQGNYSAVARAQETELLPLLRKLNMSFYAYSPIAGGFLTKTREQIEGGKTRFSPDQMYGLYHRMYVKDKFMSALEAWAATAARKGFGCARGRAEKAMENYALICSPKLVAAKGLISRRGRGGWSDALTQKHQYQHRARSGAVVAVLCNNNNSQIKTAGSEGFASVSSSSSSTVGVRPDVYVPPPSSNTGSPLLWIGVGVGISALFSWVATNSKKYFMQQAFKTMMGQMSSQNTPFSTTAFSSGFPPPPSSPPPAASKPFLTVDVPATTVEAAPSTQVNSETQIKEEPKRYAFVDVSPEEMLQNDPLNTSEDTKDTSSRNIEVTDENGAATKQDTRAYNEQSNSTRKAGSVLSVEALEKMMEDPTVQKMVFPYLPEEMRNPTTFKWMLQNPQYRQQLEDMLNNMGGSGEWDNKMMESLKSFDLSSPEVKQQFDQIGLTPEEVISKIMANPEIAVAFQNPRVQAAIMDCSQNPLSIAKYQNDKEVMDVFNKISELFPGVTGSP